MIVASRVKEEQTKTLAALDHQSKSRMDAITSHSMRSSSITGLHDGTLLGEPPRYFASQVPQECCRVIGAI